MAIVLPIKKKSAHGTICRTGLLAAAFLLTLPLATAAQTRPNSTHRLDRPPDKTALASILARLEDNIDDFNQTVPSFLCSEHVISEMEPAPGGGGSLRTATDSIFRVRRSEDPADPSDPKDVANDPDDSTQTNQLHESRIIKMIDGNNFKPEEAAKQIALMNSPYVVFGIFSGGLTRVSTTGTACFHYKLHPAPKGNGAGRIVIDFESWPRKDHAISCPYPEKMSGHALIDPASMRVVRMDNTTYDAKGTWSWSVDYSPIVLGSKTFWLPTMIRSEDIANTDTLGDPVAHGPKEITVIHRLAARYADYHLRTDTSKIVSGSSPAPIPSPTAKP